MVTGSTDGIGKAYAKELATRDINLILISRNLDKLEKTRCEILNVNPDIEVRIIQVDFSEGKQIYEKIRSQLENVPIGILGKQKKTNKKNIYIYIIDLYIDFDKSMFRKISLLSMQ